MSSGLLPNTNLITALMNVSLITSLLLYLSSRQSQFLRTYRPQRGRYQGNGVTFTQAVTLTLRSLVLAPQREAYFDFGS